jgi:hypothetical protein
VIRALALLVLGLASGAALAQDAHWYAGARGGIVVTDQNYRNDGTAWIAHVGRTWGPQYAVELEFSADELDFGIDYGLKHRAIGINHLTINREPLWDPYFLIGVGVIEFDAPPGSAETGGTDFMANLAVGGQWELWMPGRAFLRAEVRLRYDHNDTGQPGQNGFGDGIVTVGLVVPFRR